MAAFRFLAPLLAFACAMPAAAQTADGFDLSATIRLRYETIADQARAGFNRDDDLFDARTTIMARYDAPRVTLAADLWDSRVYGGDARSPITTGEVNTLELVQAYAQWRFGEKRGWHGTLTGGRYLLNIGSRRLVAADDYRNTTNGYTGMRAELTAPGGGNATLIYVLPQQRRPDDLASLLDNKVAPDREGVDLVLWGGTAAQPRAIGPVMLEASFYHLGERDRPGRPTRKRSLDTWGGRLMREPAVGKADVEIEAFRQSGRIAASTLAGAPLLPVAAWFVHADAGYTFPGPWKPRLSVEYDRASGDAGGGAYNRFDTLFGMRRADFAPAGLYNALARTNISTPGARVEVVPSKRWDAFASYHALWLASRTDAFSASGVRDATGRSGSFAGHQIDVRARYWIVPDRLRFEFDGVLLAKGRFLRDAPNAPPGGQTRYISFNLTASF